ncbi:hypothetical protein AK812_SmicGene31391 [Symbiodinium microadriaticum]|uniref:Uncharacterized protein n=1 Tax=Symbiodinium microadriaticum TaxID=2951 RepID=A0A1Q9CWU6_SYMMI|nr:hypothetical protein AK812_SmicGene31391 [Symbiodinium microadriaticum]
MSAAGVSDYSPEQNNTYAVTADMARQYKALQEELIYKINSLDARHGIRATGYLAFSLRVRAFMSGLDRPQEIQLTEQTEELDLTNFELKELTRDKADLSRSFLHLNERMNEMSGEFANMLHETLERFAAFDLMKHHISDKLSDAALGDADGSRPDFTQRLQVPDLCLNATKQGMVVHGKAGQDFSNKAYNAVAISSKAQGEGSNKAVRSTPWPAMFEWEFRKRPTCRSLPAKIQAEAFPVLLPLVSRSGAMSFCMQENDVVFVGLFWSSFGSPFESPVWFPEMDLQGHHRGLVLTFHNLNTKPTGFPPDLDLLQMADDIVVRFQAKPAEAAGFRYWVMVRFKEAERQSVSVEFLAVRVLGGFERFCLLGYVSALFVRARHLMLEEGKEMLDPSGWGVRISLDFLDSSPWPVSILDIFLNINQTDFLTYASWSQTQYVSPPDPRSVREAQYAARNPVRPPSVPLESLHWQPPPDLVQRSLEPVDMLTRFFRVKATFFGLASAPGATLV